MNNPRKLKRAVIKEEFVALTGDLVSAIFLNQLLYWTERVKDVDAYIVEEKARGKGADMELNHGWIYKKAEELITETMVTISESTARRRLEDLTKLGIIECRTNPNNKWDKVLQYRVNLVELSTALFRFGYPLSGYSLPDDLVDSRKRQFDASENHGESTKKRHESSALHHEAAIPEITTKTTSKITTEGDHTIQDHPGASATEPPTPTAAFPENSIAVADPGKAEEPKPIRGGSQLATTQPEQPFVVKPGEYLPGLPDPRQRVNGQATKLEGLTKKNEQRGITPELFTEIVNAYLDETDQLSTANGTGRFAQTALTDAQEFVDTLLGQDKRFGSVTAMRTLFRSWEADNKGLKSPPSAKQVLAQAERIVKGKAGNSLFVPAGSEDKPAPTPERTDFRGCTIVDVPTPAPTADQVAAAELNAKRSQLQHRLTMGPMLYPSPGAKRDGLISEWRTWNAEHPDRPVSLPKEWVSHISA